MRYVSAKMRSQAETYTYRNYTADALKVLTSNTAKFNGGAELVSSYRDLLTSLLNHNNRSKQELSGDEIIRKMKCKISKLGG